MALQHMLEKDSSSGARAPAPSWVWDSAKELSSNFSELVQKSPKAHLPLGVPLGKTHCFILESSEQETVIFGEGISLFRVLPQQLYPLHLLELKFFLMDRVFHPEGASISAACQG